MKREPSLALGDTIWMTDMLDAISVSPISRIGAVVVPILARHGLDGPVADDAELGPLGLTSIDMVEVMLGVEAEFDVAIPANEITLANFRSIASMAGLLSRLRAV